MLVENKLPYPSALVEMIFQYHLETGEPTQPLYDKAKKLLKEGIKPKLDLILYSMKKSEE